MPRGAVTALCVLRGHEFIYFHCIFYRLLIAENLFILKVLDTHHTPLKSI